ncbi:hypothetical protein M422DRAFT_32530 [Sphaerobolus stellatus SS14]|uniref:DBF4-type domain-containing protein n=1 Tax=Sphaerobolus stellatus (strain SS14) TaxID=990650 RepID=A0A0C9VP98_SPHS4|nr:hypothetical protein M422DRAFT_32530 [Sphaerobolus stellatus SS14]
MASVLRRPLGNRQADQSTKTEKLLSPFASAVRPLGSTINIKRPRSPEAEEVSQPKRSKILLQAHAQITNGKSTIALNTTKETKERKEKGKDVDRVTAKDARHQAQEEFVTRYTKAFPTFVFFFDERDGNHQHVEQGVTALGARVELFFSSSVTHVITNRPQPPKNEQYKPPNKENKENVVPKGQKTGNLKSPINLKSRFDHGVYDKLVRDAVQLNKKIWNVAKLESVLNRLRPFDSTTWHGKNEEPSPALTELLENERIHGTLERDPRERRHDYAYFTKGSYFLLIEDIKSELAPIGIMEYPGPSREDKTPYPVLYMDPRARSPYTKWDEKEARQLKKAELNEKLKNAENEKKRARVKEQLKLRHFETKKLTHKLQRRASMGNLEAAHDLTCPAFEEDASLSIGPLSNSMAPGEQVASGFGPSTTGFPLNAYLAASGNSVAITSTTTTSLARSLANANGSTRLPLNLRQSLGKQVLMNRAANTNKENPFEQRLRKAKSTTTLKLPPREETKKPGYCEACRVKFEDFAEHIKGLRHRKFAMNPSNYTELDGLLRRLWRKPKHTFDISNDSDSSSSSDDSKSLDLEPGDYFYRVGGSESQNENGSESGSGSGDEDEDEDEDLEDGDDNDNEDGNGDADEDEEMCVACCEVH